MLLANSETSLLYLLLSKNYNQFFQFKKIKAAGFIAAAFFLFAAEAQQKNKENWQDIIQKAYNLSIQKDRSQAMLILGAAIKKEPSGSAAAQRLKQVSQEISATFFTDKSLQAYEGSFSLKAIDQTQAFSKMNDAYKFESDNSAIVVEFSRQLIGRGDCNQAVEILLKHKKINLFGEDVNLALAQAYHCTGDLAAYQMVKNSADYKSSTAVLAWQELELEKAIKHGQAKIKEYSDRVISLDPDFPEVYYFLWKQEASKDGKRNSFAQKYLNLCSKIDTKLFQKYILEPSLCRRITEVEAWQKKQE